MKTHSKDGEIETTRTVNERGAEKQIGNEVGGNGCSRCRNRERTEVCKCRMSEMMKMNRHEKM
jgi:hypothetical protein